MGRYLVSLLLVVLLQSCNNKSDTTKKYIAISNKEFKLLTYERDTLVSEQSYFVNNQNDTLLDGVSKEYFRNGTVKAMKNYYLGMQDSFSTEFYQSGKIMGKYYYRFGFPFGVWYNFYEDGTPKSIKIYARKSISFQMDFSPTGDIIFKQGVPALVYIYSKQVNPKEGLAVLNEAINLQNYKTKLTRIFTSLTTNRKTTEVISDFAVKNDRKLYHYNAYFKSSGIWFYETEIELTDIRTGTVVANGTTSDTITVGDTKNLTINNIPKKVWN